MGAPHTKPENVELLRSGDDFGRQMFPFWDLVTDGVRLSLLKVPLEIWSLDEVSLRAFLYPKNVDASGSVELPAKAEYDAWRRQCTKEVDDQLRENFWEEFTLSCLTTPPRKMNMGNVYRSVLSQTNFTISFLNNPLRVSWMVQPIRDFDSQMKSLLRKGISRLSEILEMPLKQRVCRCFYYCMCKPPGVKRSEVVCACNDSCRCPEVFDARLADVVLKAYEKIELRVKGSVPQIVKQSTVSMNLHAHEHTHRSLPKSIEDVDREIAELRKKLMDSPLPSQLPASVVGEHVLDVTDKSEPVTVVGLEELGRKK